MPCNCCGREFGPAAPKASRAWCLPCATHIDPEYVLPASERTFEAQYGTPCPYKTLEVVRSAS